MAIVQKTNKDGVDYVIDYLQNKFYLSLLSFWEVGATYQSYPRANKNFKGDNVLPEVSLNEKDYLTVLNDDKFSVTSFFLNNDTRVYQDEYNQIRQSISLIFQADLVQLYGASERYDEQFNMDVLRIIKKENKWVVDDIEIVEGIDNVFSDITLTGRLKDSINRTDISQFHCVKFTFNVLYKYKCGALPSLASVCPVATYRNSDNSFSQSIVSGGSYVAPDVTITINGTPQTPIPANTDASFNVSSGVAGNSLNGTSLTDIAAGTTKTFTITYADLSPVVVTTTSDNATAFVGTVPNPAGTIAPFRPVLTQAASVATYDEKWHIDNGTFDYPYTTNSLIQQLDPTDPQKVLFDDSAVTGISAHKYRWINPTTGGYFNSDDGTYRDSNGNVSTYAAVFKPGTYYLGVDRWTWILWNLKRGSSFTWADALNEPPSATLDGITGFFLPPQPYFDTLDRNDKILPTYLNDNPPMDIQLNKWSCTAYAASPTTQAWEVLNNGSETAASNVLSFVASYMKPYTW